MIRAVICGWGYGAKTIHCPIIEKTKGIDVYGIVTSQKGIQYKQAKIFNDLAEACADQNVNVLIVTNTNQAHFETAKTGLIAGKHVIVDKPMCLTSEEAKELIRISKEMNRALTVFHNRRFDGDFLTTKELIDSGRLGKISWIEVSWNAPLSTKKAWKLAPSEQGGGRFFDLGSHMIDQILMLFPNEKLVSVFCKIQNDFKEAPQTDSHAHVILTFSNGVSA
jgi:scyllo-inositol 2-dehydrogenase (NADP+)